MTFDEAEKALDAGKLEMMRPWGDYVGVTRAGRTFKQAKYRMINVTMEAEVVSSISEASDRFGQPGLRVKS